MSIVRWSDNYATGIGKIDDQHQTLFKAVNQLHEAFKSGAAKDQIGIAIEFLVRYTVEHFRDEEGFMEKYGYDGLAAHRAEHQLLLSEVSAFSEKFRKAPDSVRPMEVARFLGDWLTHHINQVDMKYASFLKEKGLK
jgi:hemerythrin-like metal-binding protein